MIRCLRFLLLAGLLACAAAHAFFFGPPPPNYVDVREYVNDHTGHYVLLSDAAEIAAVEGGSAGPGWRRTGYAFTAFALSENGYGGDSAQPVCRFYAPGPNSHFFTVNAAECDFLRTHDTGWIYEKTEFKVHVPGADGSCARTDSPVDRAYNNRFAENDSNHRYYFDERVRAALLQSAWADEGVAFCAVGTRRDVAKFYTTWGTGVAPSAECGTAVSSASACVALRALPPMTQRLQKYLPPTFSQVSPDYSSDFAQVTGWLPFQDIVYAPQLTANHADDAKHSFVEDVGSGPIGMHVAGADRIVGDYASISALYGFPTLGPIAPGATYTAFTPWPDVLDHDLLVSFQIAVATVRRKDVSSHAYGGALIDFRDASSGHHVLVTLQAFGTNTPGDFVARDVNTGHVIVSTVFRADPLFGKRLQGDYSQCTADAASGSCSGPHEPFYSFRIDGNDFRKVLALAHTVDPALSPLPSDYQVANHQLHIETYLDAEVGLEIYAPQISITY